MNEIKVFENAQLGAVRTVMVDGEPWFVAADVCKVLDHSNVTMALDRLDADERAKFNLGRQGETNIVNEYGLYALVLGSRKPEASTFKRWITHDVIPDIRKHGLYATPETVEAMLGDPDTMIAVLTEYKRERAERIRLTEQAKKDAPKVLFADSVTASDTTILIGELAKLLKQNGYESGQNRLFETLRKEGYLISRKGCDYNMPTQRSMEIGLFTIKETAITHSDGHVTISKTTKVTGKGQVYFVNRFCRKEKSA
ncbi:MAG TPA: phage antirepressor KilAC domain-containing protein [Candidatus Limiplasma sp.]|nr:phage antirepressor KilAC domain-containing protein [Candidatus Limiplasma sp.]